MWEETKNTDKKVPEISNQKIKEFSKQHRNQDVSRLSEIKEAVRDVDYNRISLYCDRGNRTVFKVRE